MWSVGSDREIMPSNKDHNVHGKQKEIGENRLKTPLMAFVNYVPIRNRIDIESVQYVTHSSLPSLSPGFNIAKQIPAMEKCNNEIPTIKRCDGARARMVEHNIKDNIRRWCNVY